MAAKGSGPPKPDFESLEAGLAHQGLPLEVEAYRICNQLDWNAVHADTYGAEQADGSRVWREIDVHAWKRDIILDDGSSHLVEQLMTVAVECKWATGWWVLVDVGASSPRHDDFVLPPVPLTSGDPNTAAIVISVVRSEGDHVDPHRTTAYRELAWDYGNPDQPQIQPTIRQVLSAREGLGFGSHASALARPNPTLQHLAAVILTNRQPVVARPLQDANGYNYELSDWIIHGKRPEVVHIVTLDGLNRLLTFLDAVIEGLKSPLAVDNVRGRIEKARPWTSRPES